MQRGLKFLENSIKINMLAPAWQCGGGGGGTACKHTVLTTLRIFHHAGGEAEGVAMKTRFVLNNENFVVSSEFCSVQWTSD